MSSRHVYQQYCRCMKFVDWEGPQSRLLSPESGKSRKIKAEHAAVRIILTYILTSKIVNVRKTS